MKFINEIVDELCDVLGFIRSCIPLFIVLFGFALFTVIPWGLGIAQMFRSLFG